MLRSFARAVLAGALALALATGCQTVPPPDDAASAARPWEEQRVALTKLDRYVLVGRVAVAAGQEGFSASLRYEQRGNGADLALDGPLGIGGMRAMMRGDDLRITTSKGATFEGAEARAELERRLGFALPLAELRWWLLGVPALDVPADTMLSDHDAPAPPERFTQSGWDVVVTQRAPAMGFLVPRRLTVERPDARLKLVVDRWERP